LYIIFDNAATFRTIHDASMTVWNNLVSEMTYHVSSGTLNSTHLPHLRQLGLVHCVKIWLKLCFETVLFLIPLRQSALLEKLRHLVAHLL